jgi:hypothetical protein
VTRLCAAWRTARDNAHFDVKGTIIVNFDPAKLSKVLQQA